MSDDLMSDDLMSDDLMTELDTRPPTTEPPPPAAAAAADPARLGPGGTLRFVWTQLTSMRTALVLLFALAVAAVPGSLVPQRDVSPIAVSDYLRDHPTLGPVYDRLGLFEVYTSPWFSAIYLLLFVSLVGCIVPRLRVYARALRAAPPRTPRHLHRLPVHAPAVPADDDVLDRAEAALRASRYRVARYGDSVSAERGYSREAGNLVFHLSLLFLLLGVAVGGLFGFRGTAAVVVGQGFANTLTQYDDISAGGSFSDDQLAPFTVAVRDFRVAFETGPVQTGAARLFELDVEVTESPGATPYTRTIKVNHPLTIDGTKVHLIAHGYAPRITVLDGRGQVAASGPVIFLPQDGNFTSLGVIKVPNAEPEQLAFQGVFSPSAVVDERGPRSVFPGPVDPRLYLTGYHGPPDVPDGRPENVYSLDTTGLTPFRTGEDFLRIALQPGQSVTLPGGRGEIRFDGLTRWVKLQVSDTPGLPLAVGAVAFAVAGLCLSLFVRPRRVWVRRLTGPDAAGSTLVEVGGLDRADARAGLDTDVADLSRTLGRNPPTDETEKSLT